ncbi:uncharacterized protein LOC128266673 [Drosophila gunungcola]|uniref:Uncharacterized protein n=1 Tax=Drosophila gunungcola TaxID=103775 RepID=A0A9P9YYV6_9MUSC|nr:uncharacterized protein LOC128266673 [Drosophila gunungcola]KAI8045209.1 hypothetical protein M5D96_001389 [Drosophila gunungcola]
MADAIRCACDSLNSVVGYLVTMRICEIRQCLEFLGVAHTEVIAGVVLFVLMQFTKFTVVLLLAILLAYGIFYLWDTFFPEISKFGHRGMKMFRNVRTSANLPPFASDTEETPGEYFISPKIQQYTTGMITPKNSLKMPMLLPMLPNKNLRTTSLQTDHKRREEENRRGSRGRGHSSHRESQDPGKHRQERPNWQSVNPEPEREHHSSKRTSHGASGSGGGAESKRMSNVLRIPNITSGVVDTRRLPAVTSEQLKQLPNITSGESRRIPKGTSGANESKKLHRLTSKEIVDSRKVPKITSGTNESRWLTSGQTTESRRAQRITSSSNGSRRLPNITSGEAKETRRSSHPRGANDSRRHYQGHRDGGGRGESKGRRPSEKSHPAQGRPEEQSKQRRSNNVPPGVTRRQFPEDQYERLKIENREYQARHLQASGPAGFHQSLRIPTSEGAQLTKQDNFIAGHRHRNTKSSNPNKDAGHQHRSNRVANLIF